MINFFPSSPLSPNLLPMSNRDFNFPISVLTYNASLLRAALADPTVGPPVLTRLSSPTFLTDFDTLLAKVTGAPAAKAGQMGGTGTLTLEQNDALAELRRLASAARRTAGITFKGNNVLLHEEFKVGTASGQALSDELADAKIIATSAAKYASQLAEHGWTAQDATDLAAANDTLSAADLSQETSKKTGPGMTGQANADANLLYKNTQSVQNAARLQFPSTQPGNETARARYLIGIFPPHGGNTPPPAPPTPPTPPTP